MRKIGGYIGVVLLALVVSCDSKNSSKELDKPDLASNNTKDEVAEAYNLMKTNCYSCHHPSALPTERVAPPMLAVKAHYMEATGSREQFIAKMQEFIAKPSAEASIMPNAVEKFGLMPYQEYKKEDIEKIAGFLFDYKIPEPEWFKEHYQKEKGKVFEQKGLDIPSTAKTQQEIGLEYALETKQLLGKNLQQKLKQEGAEQALDFCNINAIPLTQQVADKHNISIKRASDKPRNPNNKATKEELKVIMDYKKQLANEKTLAPVMEGNHLYVPILTNEMCLKCHGVQSSDIAPKVSDKIKKLYPKDMATGYKQNELRGIFSIKLSE